MIRLTPPDGVRLDIISLSTKLDEEEEEESPLSRHWWKLEQCHDLLAQDTLQAQSGQSALGDCGLESWA